MSTNFPTSLDSYTTKSASDTIEASHINNPQDAIEAIEAKVGIDDSAVTTSHDYKIAILEDKAKGLFDRSLFSYKDADEFYLGAAAYMCKDKVCYWTSTLTEQIVGASSSTWYYVYLDHSAITSGTEITATEIITSDTAPTFNGTYRGYYNGDDRCIFAVYSDGSGNITEFFHDGGDYVMYDEGLLGGQTSKTDFDYSGIDVDTTWDDVYLPVPAFTEKAGVTFKALYGGSSSSNIDYFYYRKNGSSGDGHLVSVTYLSTYAYINVNQVSVYCDSSGIIEVKCSQSDTATISVWANGWFFPRGM